MNTNDHLLLQTKRFNVVRTKHAGLPDREVIRHPGAVTILPLVDDHHVCLIKNYRMSVDETLIELPAGTLELGEPLHEAAERELAEETGYRAANIELLHTFFMSPGILDERMHLYVARNLTSGARDLQVDERMENLIVAWDEALAMCQDGRIKDAKTLVGLLHYDRIRKC